MAMAMATATVMATGLVTATGLALVAPVPGLVLVRGLERGLLPVTETEAVAAAPSMCTTLRRCLRRLRRHHRRACLA